MGLIKAGIGALGGTLADQWKEFFYCDSLDADILAVKGQKRISGRSSNTKGNDNIISNGSGIAVADGQCMMIVEQGRVLEVCAEPGEYTFDNSTEPSIFAGSLGKSIIETFKTIGRRFTYGGDTGKDQRVYYFNTKEIVGNKYGTASPVPFRVVDNNIGLDIDISIRCNGEYSYKITNPLLFYTNVCGNVQHSYNRSEIDSMLKTELLTALQPAFDNVVPALFGAMVASFGINSVTASKEDAEMIKQLQKSAVMRDPNMAAATLIGAQSDAMRAAAQNEGGAMMGFMGLGMAQQAGGANAQDLFNMGKAGEQARPQPDKEAQPASKGAGWVCSCGAANNGKFCSECGAGKPQEGWICSCGAVNKGKFCSECGQKKPQGALLYKCDKCGWEPEDPAHPPKFCPECGDKFDEDDVK